MCAKVLVINVLFIISFILNLVKAENGPRPSLAYGRTMPSASFSVNEPPKRQVYEESVNEQPLKRQLYEQTLNEQPPKRRFYEESVNEQPPKRQLYEQPLNEQTPKGRFYEESAKRVDIIKVEVDVIRVEVTPPPPPLPSYETNIVIRQPPMKSHLNQNANENKIILTFTTQEQQQNDNHRQEEFNDLDLDRSRIVVVNNNNNNRELDREPVRRINEYDNQEQNYDDKEVNKRKQGGFNRGEKERNVVQDNKSSSFNRVPERRIDRNELPKQDLILRDNRINENVHTQERKNAQNNKSQQMMQQGKTRRLCEKKYSEYIERIYRNDNETIADANDSDFDGRVLASPGEYPHMTALGFKREDKSIDYKCGGSLISENYVITAAHCTNVTGEVPTLARIGDVNLMVNEKHVKPQMYRIRDIYVHPQYEEDTYYNDIALLQLNASVEFTEFVRPIKLWSHAKLPFDTAFAMGYGATSFARAPTQQLTDFNMTIIANDECNERLPQLDEIPRGIVASQICAEDFLMHRDTCQGDSGGPLQYNIRGKRRRNRIHYQLIGITSFGLLCRSPNPGVYTRIYSYLDWIESTVWIDS